MGAEGRPGALLELGEHVRLAEGVHDGLGVEALADERRGGLFVRATHGPGLDGVLLAAEARATAAAAAMKAQADTASFLDGAYATALRVAPHEIWDDRRNLPDGRATLAPSTARRRSNLAAVVSQFRLIHYHVGS